MKLNFRLLVEIVDYAPTEYKRRAVQLEISTQAEGEGVNRVLWAGPLFSMMHILFFVRVSVRQLFMPAVQGVK